MPDLNALARAGAVVRPALGWETLVVTGPDRRTWLEGLVTCEVKSVTPGSGAWGLALNRQGKIQSVLWVAASAEALWLAFAPGTGAAMEAELGRMLIMEDAELTPAPEPQSWLSLHGPEAAALAARWAEQLGGVSGSVDFTGLGGAVLALPRAREGELLEAASGRLLADADWTRLRLERGVPELGVDFDARDRPHEAGLERRAVNWSKGCYLGQEVVCMQDMRGKVKRSVRVLAVAAPAAAPIAPGAALPRAGSNESAGSVTSCAFSERAGGWLVMGHVELDALDAELMCLDSSGALHPARLAQPL